jgi:hypothetical protein
MEGSDVLQTIAEVAIALAGFTGIVAALRGQTVESLSSFALFRFLVLLIASLVALGLALLPFLFHYHGVPPPVTWSACSAVVAVIMVPLTIHDTRAYRDYSGDIPKFDQQAGPVMGVLWFALWVVQISNVFFLQGFGPYLTAPMWFLGVSALQFTRFLLTPSE